MTSLKLHILGYFFVFEFFFLQLQSFCYSLLPSLEAQSIHNGNEYYGVPWEGTLSYMSTAGATPGFYFPTSPSLEQLRR